MSLKSHVGRRHFSCAAIAVLLAIVGHLAAREDVREKKPVAAKPESLDDPWSMQMKSRLGPFSAEALQTGRRQTSAVLGKLDAQLNDLPDGAIWRKTWQLKQLGEQLAAPKPNVGAIQTTSRALATSGPVVLEPGRRSLVYLLGNWLGMAGATPQSTARAMQNIETLLRAAHRENQEAVPQNEEAVRLAFRELAALRRFDDLLGEYRATRSGFSYRVRMSDDYIEEESRRTFEVPVAFPTYSGGMSIFVRGTAVSDATVEVVPNETQGELRVEVFSNGRFALSGSKKKMSFTATSLQRMRSTQPMYLDPAAIETPGPTVRDRSCTTLNSLHFCTCLPIIGRIASRVARPIASRKVAEQDPVIARKVEDQLRERVAEEGFDIAYRVNGKFGAIGSEFFPNDGDKPRLTIRSTADDITWSAVYADADELGALSPPASDASTAAASFEVRHWAHESAAENWGTRLNGKPLDEATFRLLLKEDLNLFSKEFDAMPTLRTPAVLLFANDEPLGVKFRDGAVELTLRLQGYSVGRDVNWKSPKTVKLRYRLVADANGIRLVRENENYLKDIAWKRALDHFLPAVYEPLPRFHNGNFKTRLTLQMLTIADGWLSTGANRTPEPRPADKTAADVKSVTTVVADKLAKE